MTTHDPSGLLAAIIAKPADDAPRLQYADWLEENGEVSHAGFIRSQIAGEARCPPLTVVADVEWVFGKEAHTLTREGVLGSASVYASISRDVPILVYRRGFVCSVHCTERQWMGGECERCVGRGRDGYWTGHGRLEDDTWHDEGVECPQCHGTGRIVGIGPRLVREHPIERVVVTDLQIFQSGGNDTFYVGGLGKFPKDMWRSLDGHRSRMAARDAHSDACIEWAKRQGAQ